MEIGYAEIADSRVLDEMHKTLRRDITLGGDAVQAVEVPNLQALSRHRGRRHDLE